MNYRVQVIFPFVIFNGLFMACEFVFEFEFVQIK